jgi:hypothetical protein
MKSSSTPKVDGAYTTAPIESDPEFITVPGAQWRWSLGRSNIYTAIAEGEIDSICLRRNGKARGRRLLNVASIKRWLSEMPTNIDETLKKHCRRAGKASQKKRKEKAEQQKAGAEP